MFLRSAIEEINGFRFMIDKLEIQSGLAKRILNTLPYLHSPETIAQELDKTEVTRNILQTSELTDTITKIKVKLMQVKDIRGTANRVTESQVLDDIELKSLFFVGRGDTGITPISKYHGCFTPGFGAGSKHFRSRKNAYSSFLRVRCLFPGTGSPAGKNENA